MADFNYHTHPDNIDRQRIYVASVGGQHWRGNSRLLRRGHRYHLLMYTTAGAATGRVNDDPIYAETGSIWIFPRNKTYTYTWDPARAHWSYYWIEFDGEWAAGTLELMQLHRQHHFHHCQTLWPTIERISKMIRSDPDCMHEAMALLLQVFAGMERLLLHPPRQRQSDSLSTTVKKFIADHLDEPIQLRDIAKHVHRSPFHLSRLFKEACGVTPMKYLRQQRLARARSLFERGDLNVSEVGQAVGYPVLQHFSRMFKAEYGMSPRAYLREKANAP